MGSVATGLVAATTGLITAGGVVVIWAIYGLVLQLAKRKRTV
jgi:hypothetical protein